MKLDHIGIAVSSIQKAADDLKKVLTFDREDTTVVPEEKVRVAMLWLGDVRLELLEPIENEGAVGRFLERRGEGIHHITVRVDDLEACLKRAAAGGVEIVDRTPRRGAYGTRVAFIHPKSAHGILLELVEEESGSKP